MTKFIDNPERDVYREDLYGRDPRSIRILLEKSSQALINMVKTQLQTHTTDEGNDVMVPKYVKEGHASAHKEVIEGHADDDEPADGAPITK